MPMRRIKDVNNYEIYVYTKDDWEARQLKDYLEDHMEIDIEELADWLITRQYPSYVCSIENQSGSQSKTRAVKEQEYLLDRLKAADLLIPDEQFLVLLYLENKEEICKLLNCRPEDIEGSPQNRPQ